MISHKKCSHDWGVMTTNFLGKFGETVFILRNAFIYRGLRRFLGDCYTLSPLYIRRIKRKQHETMESYLALLEERDNWKEESAAESETDPQEDTIIEDSEDDLLMKRVVAYLEDNLGNSDLTIQDIAQAVAVSRTSLHRKMKQIMGTSPMEFLREARIRKAAKMLTTTTKNVSEIAYFCGFQTRNILVSVLRPHSE